MIKQTTLQNILTWVIAVVLFIFQSLNYFIAWIKKYVIHGQKTTTVVTADTTISSESNLNNSNVPENVITVQGLIQKHFDIPLIIAEDEPKVYSFIKNAKLLTSNEICKEKTKIDQFMENLVDDSYVARGLGLITATVGRQSEFYLYSKYDKNFENIVIRLNGRNGEIGQITILSKNHENIVKPKSIPMNYFYDKDRIKVTYTPFAEGVYTLTLERNSLSICRSPYYISVEKSPTNSRSQIRLGTKKYKPVTKFAKSKNSSLDTCDNSIPVIEPNKPSTCKTILPESEKNSIRTDVMSIVTKFESNSIHFQNKVKSTSNISEKESETNLVSDLNSPSIHSKTISTDNNFWNDVDITYKNSKASDTNTINFKSELIKKPMTKLNKCIGKTKDIPEVKNVSTTHLQSTNMVLVESLKIGNSHDVEKDNQTFKTIELMEENKHIEKHLDYKARINDTEIKCIDDEPCIQNEVSCFDDEDRKTVVVTKNSNEIESNLNDTVIQQITDSAQYNINTPFTSVIRKITNCICEKCSIEVLKIISEFPRDINIAHKNYSNEMRSSFETLLAQPINININIDNMFEHPIIATNERDSENILNISPTKIKRIDKIDKGIKCSYLNEIEPIDNNSDERCDKKCDDINNMSKELMIKQNKDNGKIDKTLKDEIFDHCIVPLAEHTVDKHNTGCQNNELSKNEIMKIKYATTNEENVLHSNQFYNNTIHKSDSKMEIQRQHLQKSLEHSIDLIKTNQFHENINEELNLLSKESDKPLDTSDLITINNAKNTNYELVKDEFKINNAIIPDENTNIQCSVINNIVLATSEYKSEDNEEQTNNISYNNVTLTSTQNDNQKSMIEKSIEPVITSFKNKMVEKITQLYLNMDLPNTDNTSTFETYDKHLTNDLPEIKINNNANSTEINPKCIETVTSQLKNHIDKNEILEIILDQQKTDDNHLFKYIENIIKTKINPSGLYAKTLGEKKLQTLVNTAMNYQNDQQIDNEFKRMIIDNEIQDEELKKINDNEIVQDIKAMLVETPNVKIIKNSDELILSKNEVTVKRQCKIPLINDFDSIKVEKTNTDSKQEMQTINVNENDTIVDTNTVEIKALQNFKKTYNTEIITPAIEHRPTIETQVMNTSELVTVEKHSSKEIQTTSEIINSINIHEETNAVENIDDKNEYESVKLHFKESVIIKIPHLVEKETFNKVVENISTNISAKSNSTENLSLQTEIESPGLKKVYSANDVTIESDIIYKLPSLNKAENIVNDKLNPKSIRTPNAQVSKNAAKVTIGINTSDQQFSNTAITVLIPSKIPTIEPIDSQSESDKKDNEMLIYTETETPTVIDTSTASLVCKIVVEFVKNKNKTPIEELEIIAHEQIEEDTETVREITSTMNSLIAVTDEQVYIKKYGSDSYYEKSDNYITNTETKTQKSIGQNNAGKYTEKESPAPINTLTGVVMENLTANIVTANAIISCTNSSTETVDVKTVAEKVVEEESPSPINSLVELLQKNMNTNINTENVILLPIESIKEPKIEDIIENEITSCTESSTEMTDSQNHAEKIVDPKLPLLINSSDEVVGENTNLNIDTENKTLLPVESNMQSIEISKEVEDINETEKIPCTISSTETVDVKIVAETFNGEQSNSPINSLVELLQKNMNINIKTENETLLSIESIEKPKIEDITVPEITSCTESSTANMMDVQRNKDKYIAEKCPVNSSVEEVGEKSKLNIYTEDETLLPVVSTKESIEGPKIEDIIENEITSCTESSTEMTDSQNHAEKIFDPKLPLLISSDEVVGKSKILLCIDSSTDNLVVQTDIDKVLEEESNSPINSLGELVNENMNINISTENETLLSIESIEEPRVENIIENEITSCTESSTEMTDSQNHAEKIVDPKIPFLINSSDEVVRENTNLNIDTENKTLLPIGSTMKSIEISKEVDDINETEKIPYTNSSTETVNVKTIAEKVIVEESLSPIISLVELLQKNMNTNISKESKTLLPIESLEELKIEDITEPEITSNTEYSKKIIQYQDHAEKMFDQEAPPVPVNFSDEEVDKKSKVVIDTETKTHLPILSILESIKKSKVVEGIIGTKIPYCTESSTEYFDMQIGPDNVILKLFPTPTNDFNEILGEKTKVNVNTESEAFLPINNYVKEKKVIEEIYETLLPIESAMEFIQEPKFEENIIELKIKSCTDSTSVVIQKDIEKAIEKESSTPINSLDEEVEKNMNVNIDTENEIVIPIDSIIGPMEEKKEKNGHNDPLLTMESIKEPKEDEDITITEITTCTNSLSIILETKMDVKQVIEEIPPVLINNSLKIIGEKMKVNMDTEYENILPIKATIESIEEPKVVEDITETEITSFTESSTATADVQTEVEGVIEEVSIAPINYSVEIVGGKSKENINAEDDTLLPIESTMEYIAIPKTLEDITVTEIVSCTDSCISTVDAQTDVEKGFHEVTPETINLSSKVEEKKTYMNIDAGNETILPIKTSTCSMKDRKAIKETTKITLPIESNIMKFKKEPKLIEDTAVTEIIACTDSSSVIEKTKIDVEKVIEEVPPVLINNSLKIIGEKMKVNMDTEYENILPIKATIESIKEPKVVEDITETEITSFTESSTATADVQTEVEGVIEEVSIAPINYSVEIVGGKSKETINAEYDTLLPIESTMEYIAIPKTLEDITVTEIVSCTDSCILTVDAQTDVEKGFHEVTPETINLSSKVEEKQTYMNIDAGNETILPIKTSTCSMKDRKAIKETTKITLPIESNIMKFKKEPKLIEDTAVTEIIACTDSSSVIEKTKIDVEKVIEEVPPVLINSSDKIIREITKFNMNREYETILPIEATIEFIEKPKLVEDISETKITSCTESSTANMIDIQTNKEIYKAEKFSAPINSSVEEVGRKPKLNIDTENKIPLPIASKKECIEKNKMEPTVVTETEIVSYTESSTIIDNYQNHTEKIVEEIPISYLGKVIGESINVNIVTENKAFLPIGSTMESVEVPSAIEDITETEIKSCTESSTEHMMDAKTNNEKYMAEKSPTPINCSVEKVGGKSKVNINLEEDTPLPINLTMEYIAIPKTVEIITETKISSCIDSCILTINAQTDVEKRLNKVILEPLNVSGEVVAKKLNMNIDTGNETILPIKISTCSMEYRKLIEGTTEIALPIELTMEFKKEPKLMEDTAVTEIIACTDSSSVIEKTKIDVEKVIEEVPPVIINSSDKIIREITKVNMDREYETILPIETTDITETEITASSTANMMDVQINKEKYMTEKFPVNSSVEEVGENRNLNIDTEYETILPIESTIETITETEILSYIDFSTDNVVVQRNIEKVIEKESSSPVNSLGELVQENMNIYISTENETLLSIESIEKPKIEDITEPEITSCTESSTANMKDVQTNKDKYIAEKCPVNSSVEEVGEKSKLNIYTEDETLLPIVSTKESIEETKMESTLVTATEILSCTESSTILNNYKYHAEKIVEEVPIKYLDEVMAENINLNTVNETLLLTGSTIESIKEPKVLEDITETKNTSCTKSSTESSTEILINVQTNKEKYMAEKSEAQINSSVEEVGENTNLNIDTEYETILPIESTIESITETKILLCIDSSTDDLVVQTDVDKVIKEESTSPINFLGELVHENININISTENETLLSVESIEEPKVEDIAEPEITSCTEFSTEIIDNQYHAEKIVDVVLNNSLSDVTGENMNKEIVTVSETLLSIGSTNESILESKVEEDITVIIDVQTDIEKVIEEESPFPMKFVYEVLQENTNSNINTKNEALLLMDTHISSVEEMKEIDEIIGIDIETENETLLSIENTSVEEQMDEVDKITQNSLLVDFSAATELNGYEIVTNKETATSTLIDTLNTTVGRQTVKENFKEIVTRKRIATSTAFEEEQKSVEPTTVIENILPDGTSTASVEEEIQIEEVIKNKSTTLISYSTIHDAAALEEPKINKNETSAMRYSDTAMEEQTGVAAAEVVIDTYKDSLNKTMIEKGTHNETPTPIDILITVTDKQIHLDKVAESEIPILVNTSTESVEKQIKTEKVTENKTITQIACEPMSKIETNEFEAESENKTSTPTNNSVLIAIKQTELENLTERTLQNDDIVYKNTKTNFIGRENKTENSDNPNNFYLKFGETSKINHLENEDNLQRKSYGIQKLEMSVQRTMKTSDEDYYEKKFVQLEQTEQISKVDNIDSENKTVIDDKLYTVNESDLNAILCASSLEEALTLLDTKIKFKFKRKKSSSKINSVEYSPKIQTTTDGNSSGVNTNFTDARAFFKEIEKKSKK